MPRKRTIDRKGARLVKIAVGATRPKRVTVALTMRSDGTKLDPVVITNAFPIRTVIPPGVQVLLQRRAWMDSEKMQECHWM